MTLADVLPAYLERLASLGRSPATIRTYADRVKDFGRFLDGRRVTDLRAVTRREVDAYATALALRYVARTREAALYTIKTFFEHLVDAAQLLASPAEHVRGRHISPPIGHVLRDEEVGRLIDSINTGLGRGIRDRALVELLYATGLRRKEVIGLGVRDVDLPDGVVRVRHGKGNKERLVPLTAEARRWVGEYLREVRPLLVKKGRGAGDVLLLSWWGRPITYSGVQTLLRKIAGRAGVAGVTCHAFRRTMATGLLRGGANIKVVAEVLGHSSLAPTMRYTQVLPTDLRDVQDRTHPRGRGP